MIFSTVFPRQLRREIGEYALTCAFSVLPDLGMRMHLDFCREVGWIARNRSDHTGGNRWVEMILWMAPIRFRPILSTPGVGDMEVEEQVVYGCSRVMGLFVSAICARGGCMELGVKRRAVVFHWREKRSVKLITFPLDGFLSFDVSYIPAAYCRS